MNRTIQLALRAREGLVPALVLAAVASSSPARADVIRQSWPDADSYTYRIVHMPDLDQRRLETETVPGLPSTGRMYCVPASTMNVLAYIATHGFPEVPPEPHNWLDPVYYDLATGNLFLIGGLMSTSPTGGTGLGGLHNALDILLPLETFTYSTYATAGGYTPQFRSLAESAVNGGLVLFTHGWYSEDGMQGDDPIISRGGGHALTLTQAYGGLFNDQVYVRDPADDPPNTSQSAYSERIYAVQNRTVVAHGETRVMSNFQVTPGEWTGRYLDTYTVIRPKAGFSFTDWGIVHLGPIDLWDTSPDSQIDIDAIAQVIDVAIGPDQNYLYYVGRVGASYQLYRANLLTRESTALAVAPVPTEPRITFGRRRTLYQLAGDQLFFINPDRMSWYAVPLPATGEAIGYDDAADEVVVLDAGSRSIFTYPHHLDADAEVLVLPSAGVLPLGDAPVLAWDPFRDAWWVTSEAVDDVFRIKHLEGTWDVFKISHDVLVQPTSVDVDDAGHVFVVAQGGLHEFMEEPGGDWVLVEDSPFAGIPVGRKAGITKSRTNYDPELHDGPQWNNVLPTDFGPVVLDCRGDFDRDGSVGFSDLLQLLARWGPCPRDHYCDEDLSFNGAVDFSDLLAVLSAWGECR
ncbi:MAG: hypothetical protein HKN62_05690 [Phycisphaerales bacterium]|nr:hypothetical protein [Phycisphaerales bacterium]